MNGRPVEFADVVRHYLGEKAYYLAVVVSMLTLVGALIVYWVLMSGFLFDIVNYAYNNKRSVIPDINGTKDHFEEIWNKKTAPLFLIPILFPLLNLKDITFFTKFNSLGVVSIFYVLFFVIFTTAYGPHYVETNGVGGSPFGGFHMTNNCINRTYGNTTEECGVHEFSTNLFSLTGVLMLSYVSNDPHFFPPPTHFFFFRGRESARERER